ncbi:MAG: A/G-specific adenine glycosylase [Burkholderiales bacterium]|nr:A/G-specific adenine glycosylase [Burkholderiales bacterium]
MIAWQRAHGRHDLPWQDTRDPYRIWLAEVMLQQTQVATVLPYYRRFLDAFPDVVCLAAASIDDVLAQWSGLGYYRRAHHLHAAAREVVTKHGGSFPRDATTLETLPGIGRSTAAAIAVFATAASHPILDGNVKRVLARHAGVEGWPGAPRVAAALWDLAQERLPRTALAGDLEAYTQGMMDLGATVCTRTSPRCAACPVAADCIARREARTEALPSPRPAKPLPQRAVRVLAIERNDGCLLFERRPAHGLWGGLWSLPECALDADAGAVVRARFGVAASGITALPPVLHGFTHFRLTMHPLRLATTDPLRHPSIAAEPDRAPGNLAWLSRHAAAAAGLPAPIRRLLRSLGATEPTSTLPALSP